MGGVLLFLWFGFARLDPERTVWDAALELLVLSAALTLHLVVHEAGHALAALGLGMRVPRVELGEGTPLLRVRLGGTTVTVRTFHSGGATHLLPRSGLVRRWHLVVVTLAGPLVNLALAAVAFQLPDVPSAVGQSFVEYVVSAGLVLGLGNLIPFRASTPAGVLRSDGRAVLALFRRDGGTRARLVAEARLSDAIHHHMTGQPLEEDDDEEGVSFDRSDPAVVGMEGTRRLLTGDLDGAVALLREAAAVPHEDRVRALTLNNLAWALLLSRPDGWLEEADRAVSEAVALKHDAAMDSTQGCIFVHLGRFAEARDLLVRVDRTNVPAKDLVVLDHHLFLAQQGLGHLYGARAALFGLVDAGAPPELVDWARSVLRPMEVEHALGSMVGADGLIAWPESRRGDELARHLAEMRSALSAFVEDEVEDPRQGAVRAALGG